MKSFSIAVLAILASGSAAVFGEPMTENGQGVGHTQVKQSQTAKEPLAPSPLDTDPRLKVKVSITRRAATLSETLRALTSLTRIPFIAEDNEATFKRLSLTFTDAPLKDILDGISALYQQEWELRKSGVLVLRTKPTAAVGRLPWDAPGQDQIEKDGRKFASDAEKLSPEMQRALGSDYNVSVDDLPRSMQMNLQNMLELKVQGMTQPPWSELGNKLLANLGSARVNWTTNNGFGNLGVGFPNVGNISISFRLGDR